MMKNIALGRLGRQSSEMYEYKNGSKRSNCPFQLRMLQQVVGPLLYYQYGLENSCVRLCTEMGVEFGWHPEYFKYLTRCALLKGEWQVARKYIHQLKSTMFFDDWALHAESLIGKRDEIAKDPDLGHITHMMNYENKLASDKGLVEEFIMKQLAARREVKDSVFQEQALLATLWTKDNKQFWYHFSQYVLQHPNEALPVYFQEAAYLYSIMERRSNIDKMPFTPGVKERYEKFAEMSSRCEGMDMEEVRKILEPSFGNTFYYDYFLMSNLPQY